MGDETNAMTQPVRYLAEPTHVREVTLLGSANLAFWQERLGREGFIPAASEGKAGILIVAASMSFMGVRFTEVSFSVLLANQRPGERDSKVFLATAFNSSRWFVLSERLLFATPYQHGECRVSAETPVSIRVIQKGELVFRAQMSASSPERNCLHHGEDRWEGRVFLPSVRPGGKHHRFFHARMTGSARVYPFEPAEDEFYIKPSDCDFFQALLQSQFAADEWLVRPNATHGKSRTHKQSRHF